MHSDRVVTRRPITPGRVILAMFLVTGGMVYQRVASAQLNLTTGLLLLAAAWTGLFLLAETVSAALPALRHRLRWLAAAVGVLAFGTEIGLRVGAPSLRTYFEQSGETSYRTQAPRSGPTWFQLPPPNRTVSWTTAEFVHSRKTNSLGLSEREVPVAKAEREFRIVALGDAMTEGVGTDYETAWVKTMERALGSHVPGRVVTTLNAGASGSDIFYDYVLLREKLVRYAPDVVIVTLNTNSVENVMLRGGMERFQSDGTFRSPRQLPWWEWVYGVSFMTRFAVHNGLGYDNVFMKRSQLDAERQRAVEQIRSLMPTLGALASERGFRLVVVCQPTSGDVEARAYRYNLQSLVDDLRTRGDVRMIDVLARWLPDASSDRLLRWYWPTAGHLNREGHAAMAATIVAGLIDQEIVGDEGPPPLR
jgi:lysophospholipase L1-like esterase